MFRYAYNLDRAKAPAIQEFYIATATAIENGEIVLFTTGTGVAAVAGTDFDDPALGMAVEAHNGTTAGRQSGTLIKVICNPEAVYKVVPQTLSTVDSGASNGSTWVDAEYTAADDVFNGGKLVIVSTTTSGVSVGDVHDITDFANATGTFTVSPSFTNQITAGDTAYIYPGTRAVGSKAFDLDSDGTNINMKSAGGESLIITDTQWDADRKVTWVYCKLRLHQLGNHVVAV